jgi:hypothetical protein
MSIALPTLYFGPFLSTPVPAEAVVFSAWVPEGQPAGRRRAFQPPRPWTEEEDALVRTLRPAEAAAKTRRTLSSIYNRRFALGLTARGRRG